MTGQMSESNESWEAGPRPRFWPSFGSVLRGMRTGYRWSDKYQCFVRLSVVGRDLFLLEVAPDRGIPNKAHGAGAYSCWWDEPEILDQCPALTKLGQITAYRRIYIDDDGNQKDQK